MEMRHPFRFLQRAEFEKLTTDEKVRYLDLAAAELKRTASDLKARLKKSDEKKSD
jgi:hypothetical protein